MLLLNGIVWIFGGHERLMMTVKVLAVTVGAAIVRLGGAGVNGGLGALADAMLPTCTPATNARLLTILVG